MCNYTVTVICSVCYFHLLKSCTRMYGDVLNILTHSVIDGLLCHFLWQKFLVQNQNLSLCPRWEGPAHTLPACLTVLEAHWSLKLGRLQPTTFLTISNTLLFALVFAMSQMDIEKGKIHFIIGGQWGCLDIHCWASWVIGSWCSALCVGGCCLA